VNGNAVVIDGTAHAIEIDEGGAVVADTGSPVMLDVPANPMNDQTWAMGAPASTTDLAYCMVATPTSAPIVIRHP
jgi:hypothetical protein